MLILPNDSYLTGATATIRASEKALMWSWRSLVGEEVTGDRRCPNAGHSLRWHPVL
ncbi:hypothetical protein H6F95_00030 [Cyanobacteria bacterium FACHB-471]|nr:hypothetical protein [Cyanobacteria bacterium FACHB-471]